MEKFFNAENIAIVGASREQGKVGYTILENFINNNFVGKLFAVNPNASEILGIKCYKSILDIKNEIELAVIAVPAKIVPKAIADCGKCGIKRAIIISSGFKEVGNYKLEKELLGLLSKYNIKIIGTNCLGVFDAYSKIDTLFLPASKLKRPLAGRISFICQSGAAGSAILDLAAEQGYGIAKFVSYGNATNVDETDLLEYFGQDEKTKLICMYIEGVKNGKRFIETAKKVGKEKPIIVLKGGITKEGGEAAISHTGSMAGVAEIYFGAFEQAGIIRAETLNNLFDFARIFDKVNTKPRGKRVQIITNGGGYGILCTDAVVKNNLELAKLKDKTKKELKKRFTKAAIINNPMDLLGDATDAGYETAIGACLQDENVDILLVVLLYQTPLLSENVGEIVAKFDEQNKKPIVVVSTGSEYTERLKRQLEEKGVSCFTFPENAVNAIRVLCKYYLE